MSLADRTELLFDVGNQLLGNRVAVRTVVCGVHSITIGEERRGLHKSDQQKTRESVRSPFLEKLVSWLNVGRCSQAFLLLRASRVFIEIECGTADIALRVNCRISNVWMFVKTFWQYNCSAQVNRHAPEF